MRLLLSAITAVTLLTGVAWAAGYEDLEMITPMELMAKLDNGEAIVILDVRSRGSYNSSDLRIKGDMRIPPDELVERARELPMGASIVTYCT